MLILSVIVFLAWLANDCSGAALLRHSFGLRHDGVNDVVFLDDLLWTTSSRSKTECAVSCMSDLQCVSFTISPVTVHGKRSCRGHSTSSLTSGGSTVASPGTRLYTLQARILTTLDATSTAPEETTTLIATTTAPWHKSTCTSNAQCQETSSECFSGKCLCTPGYYYSKSSDSCLASCPLSSLQTEVVEYPMWYILGYNDGGSQATTYSTCLAACLADPQCRSFDYRYGGDVCSYSYKVVLDVPSAWTQSTAAEQLYYYQRVCV